MAEQIPDEIAAALAATVAERGVFGARLIYAAEVGSTNDLLLKGLPETAHGCGTKVTKITKVTKPV